jgi:hypothetical protein
MAVIFYHPHALNLVLFYICSSIEGTDDHYTSSKCSTKVTMGSPNASRKACCHFTRLIIQIIQNVLTHGEHDGFRSVVALVNEPPSPNCYLIMILFFIKHDETPIGFNWYLALEASLIHLSGGWRAKRVPEYRGPP